MRPSRRTAPQGLRRIFAIPILLAVASIIGLVLGLTGEGWRDVLASLLLCLPIAVSIQHWRRR
jgi:hypothetical protein